MKPKIIKQIKEYLVEENIYTEKDEITLMLLEVTYTNWLQAVKEVKLSGQTITYIDFNKNKKKVINPSFKIQLDLQKQLVNLIEQLYLTPKSRKTRKESVGTEKNPLMEMLKDISKIEKR